MKLMTVVFLIIWLVVRAAIAVFLLDVAKNFLFGKKQTEKQVKE